MRIKILSALLTVSLFFSSIAAFGSLIKLNNAKCVQARFTQKSFIKLYKIWKTETGIVYIKKGVGIIWVYNLKTAGIFNNKIFLFRKGVEPFMKNASKNDPMEFLWKNHTEDRFNITKKNDGWEFVMKKNPEYKAEITFDKQGFPDEIRRTDLFGNITTLIFKDKKTKCSFSIKGLFNKYFNKFYGNEHLTIGH